jgi:hydroxymethylglutaryl-CoA synthase
MDVGILGYGAYVPYYRLRVDDIAPVWGKNAADVSRSLGVTEKSVAGFDEDTLTLAVEAAVRSLNSAEIKPEILESCMVGSESHPYAVNPTSTIVAEYLGVGNNYFASDLEFACKAGTAGMIATTGLIKSGSITTGIIIGSDTAQAKPHDILEYTAGSGSAAYILGCTSPVGVATILDFASYSSDTPDFWRRDGARFPSHGGRFTGEPAYFNHVEGAAKRLLLKTKMTATDFDYCVFHMPNGKFPREVARRLGFTTAQLAPSLIINDIGNPYSASSLLGLSLVLDIAKPGQKIFLTSYGSGAGSDAFIFRVENGIIKKRNNTKRLAEELQNKKYITYVEYLKYRRKI